MKYKVGDKVRIRKDLIIGEEYDVFTFGLNSKCVILGIFNTYDKAVRVRVEAERKYYGDSIYN